VDRSRKLVRKVVSDKTASTHRTSGKTTRITSAHPDEFGLSLLLLVIGGSSAEATRKTAAGT